MYVYLSEEPSQLFPVPKEATNSEKLSQVVKPIIESLFPQQSCSIDPQLLAELLESLFIAPESEKKELLSCITDSVMHLKQEQMKYLSLQLQQVISYEKLRDWLFAGEFTSAFLLSQDNLLFKTLLLGLFKNLNKDVGRSILEFLGSDQPLNDWLFLWNQTCHDTVSSFETLNQCPPFIASLNKKVLTEIDDKKISKRILEAGEQKHKKLQGLLKHILFVSDLQFVKYLLSLDPTQVTLSEEQLARIQRISKIYNFAAFVHQKTLMEAYSSQALDTWAKKNKTVSEFFEFLSHEVEEQIKQEFSSSRTKNFVCSIANNLAPKAKVDPQIVQLAQAIRQNERYALSPFKMLWILFKLDSSSYTAELLALLAPELNQMADTLERALVKDPKQLFVLRGNPIQHFNFKLLYEAESCGKLELLETACRTLKGMQLFLNLKLIALAYKDCFLKARVNLPEPENVLPINPTMAQHATSLIHLKKYLLMQEPLNAWIANALEQLYKVYTKEEASKLLLARYNNMVDEARHVLAAANLLSHHWSFSNRLFVGEKDRISAESFNEAAGLASIQKRGLKCRIQFMNCDHLMTLEPLLFLQHENNNFVNHLVPFFHSLCKNPEIPKLTCKKHELLSLTIKVARQDKLESKLGFFYAGPGSQAFLQGQEDLSSGSCNLIMQCEKTGMYRIYLKYGLFFQMPIFVTVLED